MAILNYTFNEQDARQAHESWGCNCGPAALAFACQLPLDAVRPHIPDFESRRYTSPTMMRAALMSMKRPFLYVPIYSHERVAYTAFQDKMFDVWPALVRIQWGGPWVVNWVPQRWAARQTHWVVSWIDDYSRRLVFDVNGGVRTFADWRESIAPAIMATISQSDGTWFPANVWRFGPVP